MPDSPPAFFLLALALFLQSSFLDLTALDPKEIRIERSYFTVVRKVCYLNCDYYLNNRTDEQNLDLNYSGWSRQELAT